MSARLAEHLEQHPELPLASVASTLQLGRRVFPERRALVCRDRDDAIAVLRGREPLRLLAQTQEQRDRPVAFLFPGQGSQHVQMARGLYDELPLFRKLVDECATKLVPPLGLDLRQLLFADAGAVDAEARLTETQLAQPALFVIEYALAKQWMAWGVKPRVMIGHSLGEYVAACLAGVWSLDDALALVAARGRLMAALPSGAMLAVALPAVEVQAALPAALSLAAVNGPSDCVVSGPADAIDALARELAERRGARCRRLVVSHAFHSSLMEPMLQPFGALLRQTTLATPSLPWISNVTGALVTAAEATSPDYWLRHLRQPVMFARGLDELLSASNQVLLEVGPGQTLGGLARKQSGFARQLVLSSARHPKEPTSDVAHLMETMARLWLGGVTVDWAKLPGDKRRRRVPLPTYPFERKRHWVEPVSSAWNAQPTRTPAAPATTTPTPTPPPPPAPELPTPATLTTTTLTSPPAVTHAAPPHASAMAALMNEQLRVLSLQLDVIRHGNRKPEGSHR
jgi:acyl transferase domain-containing protein